MLFAKKLEVLLYSGTVNGLLMSYSMNRILVKYNHEIKASLSGL